MKKRIAVLVATLIFCSGVAVAQQRGARAPAARVAHSDQSAAERCTGVLALLTSDAGAALTALGVTPPADFAARYQRETRGFDAACASLTPEQLTCLETAPNALAAVGSCGVNENRPFNTKVNPAMIGASLVSWQAHNHEARSEATTRDVLAQLVGTWRLADAYSQQTFTVTAAGAATYVNTRGDHTETHEGTIDVVSPTHIQARMGFATFNWPFFVDGARVLFSNQTATGAYPIAARGATHLAFNGQFFVIDNLATTPTCRGFGPRLEPLDSTCAWEGAGDARKLVVTVLAHRGIESGTNSPPYPTRFVVRRNHLIPDGESMFWTRVSP